MGDESLWPRRLLGKGHWPLGRGVFGGGFRGLGARELSVSKKRLLLYLFD